MQCNLLLFWALCEASLTFLSLTLKGQSERCMGYYSRGARSAELFINYKQGLNWEMAHHD